MCQNLILKENVLLDLFVFYVFLARNFTFESICKHIKLIKETEKRISDETCVETSAPEVVHGQNSIP